MLRVSSSTLLAALAFIVFFTYPIPHTIALRNLMLVALLIASLSCIKKTYHLLGTMRSSTFRTPAVLLLALTLWLLFQSALISPRAGEALRMLRGDWFVALVVGLIAMLSALATQRPLSERVLLALTLALLAHIVGLFGYQIALWFQTGYFPFQRTPFAEKDYHSMLATMLAALALADLLARRILNQRLFQCHWHWSAATLALCGIATLTLVARNATIITGALVLTSGFVFIKLVPRSDTKKSALVLMLATMLCVGSWLSIHNDHRWSGFQEAAGVAFDTENNLAWLDSNKYPRPLTRSGAPVEESAYLRLAWAKVGIEQIAHYPLGLGYGHKAFGWAVERSLGVATGLESSHSGLIDFTLANGIPGLVLWLALSVSLAIAGWRGFRQYGSPAGLALTLSVLAYLVRCLVDGHLSGFRLEMYAFVVGVLIVRQLQESTRCD